SWPSLITRTIRRLPLTFYAGGICLFSLVAACWLARVAQQHGVHGWILKGFAVLCLLGASQLGVALMNWLTTLLVKPRLLPRMDASNGIPADCRTMVVVPTLLTTPDGVDRLLEPLEIHHLPHRSPHLYFALLTDFRDAPVEDLPEDHG